MKPDKLSVHDLFQKERRYTVPLYQRAYVWNEDEQWQPLWDDIERQADACLAADNGVPRRSHFLGAVVLNVQKIVGSAVARSEVIDGQQRLTTLQVFVAALRDFADAAGSTHANKLKRLTINEDEPPGSESSFKVWPTNADRPLFRSLMMAGGTEALLRQHGLTQKSELPRLIGAYSFFRRQVENYAAGSDAEARDRHIFGLLQALRTGLQLVVIELEENDDPQIIFETLNARGQPLLPSDLIRNTIFHQASVDPAHSSNPNYADELYETYWRSFDNDRTHVSVNGEDRYWHIPERQGRLARPRIDLFIFHFLVMQTGRELSIGHIFQEFRDWRDQSAQTLEDFLGELKRYAVIFRNFISPTGIDQVSLFAGRLRSLDTSTVYPLLLYILGLPSEKLSLADRNQIVADIECWMIRRFVCQLTNKNYNKFFVSLLAKVRGIAREAVTAEGMSTSERLAAAVREELTRSDDVTVRWPNDTEFERGWLEKPAYVKSRPDRAVMLLTAIDNAMRTNMNDYKHAPENVSVEHLLPQQGSVEDYPYPPEPAEPDGLTPATRRQNIIHTVGNLTLLTQALNSSVSNGPFKTKRPAITANSDLRLNARFQDPGITQWLEPEITARGRELFVHAKRLWPFPSSTTG
ncbi:MAG: DUF262 domain-containing protein [Salinarimonas sp.]